MTARNLAIEALYAGQEARTFSERLKAHALGRAAIAALEAETGEPVAWGMTRQDGLILDVICPKEHARYAGAYTIPLHTATPPAMPQGWKLVPIEPTPEMWKAGLANLFKDVDGVWKAMLEKAPKAPA